MTHCEICRTWDQCASQGCLAEAPKRKPSESHADQIRRVEGMASGDSTWDLSDNDCTALATVLKERTELTEMAQVVCRWSARSPGSPSRHR